MKKISTFPLRKKLQRLNTNENIKILLSRDNDKLIPVKERVEFAKAKNADLIYINSRECSRET